MLEEFRNAWTDAPNKKLKMHHHYIKIINTTCPYHIYNMCISWVYTTFICRKDFHIVSIIIRK